MARIYREKKTKGQYAWLVATSKGRRSKIGLGYKFPKRQDASLVTLVSELEKHQLLGIRPDAATQEMVDRLSDSFKAKLARIGLISHGTTPTLGDFLNAYGTNQPDWSKRSHTKFEQNKKCLIEFFGRENPLDEITTGDAQDYKKNLVRKGLAEATISRRIRYARQYFTYALQKKYIKENPFDLVKTGNEKNKARLYFVSRAELQKCLDAAPTLEWQVLILLWRIGGLRADEALHLTWNDVKWDSKRLLIHSPKTERYGKPNRLIPLWPELQPYLERLFEEAPDGSLRIIQRYQPGQNMHTTFKKIVERAGLKTWPRLIHNLRGSRQEEIEEEFGIVCATEWIGNTEAVAKDHYLRVREADFERALNSGEQIGSKQDAAKECNASPNKNSENLNANFPGISSLYNSLQNQEVGRAGLEPATKGL